MTSLSSVNHIIWDWNGTMVDDVKLCIDITNRFLRKQGIKAITRNRYLEVFGFPVQEYYSRLGMDFSNGSYEDLSAEWMVEYEGRRAECRLQPGAADALERIKKKGIAQSVLSALCQDSLESMIDHYSIRSYFTGVYGLSNQFAHSKKELGKTLLSDLSLDPDTTILIGDTMHDFEVAEAMGIGCVLLSCGHQSRKRLISTGTEVVDSLRNLTL